MRTVLETRTKVLLGNVSYMSGSGLIVMWSCNEIMFPPIFQPTSGFIGNDVITYPEVIIQVKFYMF